MREINALEASELLEEGALLVDVREPHEYLDAVVS
jgi:rhodanese-related sulfurtransferase